LTALNGLQGIELARAEDPDVILLDIVMPGMDGFEVCRRLKADERLRSIPVIFLTALRTDRGSRVRALEVGAEAFLSKPMDEQELVAQVRAMVKLKTANRLQRMEKEELVAIVTERTRELERELEERKQAVAALRASEGRFRTMVSGVKDYAIIMLDAAGRVASWNEGAERLKGYRADEIVGQHFSCFYLPEDVASGKTRQELHMATTSGRCEAEGWLVRKDGSRFIANVVITPLHDEAGQLCGYSKITRDITERKLAQQSLAQSQQMLTRVLDTIPIGVFWKDRECRYLGCNQHAARDAGLPNPAAVVGLTDFDLAWKLLADAYRADDRAVMDSGLAKINIDEKIVRADGCVQWVRTNKIPLRDASGAVFGVLGTYEDISKRKELEFEQAKLLVELERSNTDLEQFAYVASHDLKAPLRAIESLAGWLQEDLEPVLQNLHDDSRKHLVLLRQRAKRMERLLEDLLIYSRAGRVPADIVRVDISRLVPEIVEMLNPPAGFAVQLLSPGPCFTTAVTPLRQVLFNLIANAVKHHDRAGGVIEVSAQEDGDRFEFIVADDGPGIAPEFHKRIFGMFQTLRPRDDIEGSGMGLALVERIVLRYGGKVTVECRLPRGSIFRFTWPKQIQASNNP
jgi:PAS domain S-box-containing protein